MSCVHIFIWCIWVWSGVLLCVMCTHIYMVHLGMEWLVSRGSAYWMTTLPSSFQCGCGVWCLVFGFDDILVLVVVLVLTHFGFGFGFDNMLVLALVLVLTHFGFDDILVLVLVLTHFDFGFDTHLVSVLTTFWDLYICLCLSVFFFISAMFCL